jgi:hypothetical protein
VTYFHGDPALSLRYPATWSARIADQQGVRYRYFESGAAGPQRKTVTTTLVSVRLAATLDDYAQQLLTGSAAPEVRDEARGAAKGRRWRAASADGGTRHSLLLLQDGARAWGLHAQGDAAAFADRLADVESIEASLAVERVEDYPENRQADWGFAVRLPPSWSAGRTLAGRETYLTQYLSPPLAIDKGGQTVHASLTLTVEKAPDDGSVEAFRAAARRKLGDSFALIGSQPWRDGVQDLLQTETPLTVSRSKRFYRTAGGRGYGLTFEAREDVFPRVSRWCDLIASTLRIGPEVKP